MRRAMVVGVFAALLAPGSSLADEGGASLYLPGSFASMAAVPGAPGWSTSLSYYHSTGAFQNVTEKADLLYGGLSYTLATPVLAGQLTLTAVGAWGGMGVTAGAGSDWRLGAMDATPAAALRWNAGVHNYMVYTLVNVPVGSYNVSRLANFGLNHWGQDIGAGYTYFDKTTGYEFSIVGGTTFNFENMQTNYRNGIDAHVDFAASKFFADTYQLGLAGYVYRQFGADGGSGATQGSYRSRVTAVGPQVGLLFPMGEAQGYVNLRAYREFAADNRPAGWNVWMTLAVSPR